VDDGDNDDDDGMEQVICRKTAVGCKT